MMSSKGGIEFGAVGLKGTVVTKAMRPDRVSISMDIQGMGQTRTGFDGTVGWSIDPMRGPSMMKAAELAEVKRDANFLRDLALAKDPSAAEVTGLFLFENHPCWLVRLPARSATQSAESNFYDKETGLLAGMSRMSDTPLGKIPVVVAMGDYKDFGGVKLPTRTVTRVMGQEQLMTVESATWEGVTEADFELPAEIKALRDAEAKSAKPAKDAKPAGDAAPAAPNAPAAPGGSAR
jgi:hypothetical protein